MKALRLTAAVAMLVGVLAWGPAADAAPAYRTYAICSHNKSAPPATSCPRNSNKGLIFQSNNATVQFKVCVTFPQGQKLCASAQNAPKGQKILNTLTSNQRGRHTIKWSVAGSVVGTKVLTVT